MAFKGVPICTLHDELEVRRAAACEALTRALRCNCRADIVVARSILRGMAPVLAEAKNAGQRMEECIIHRREGIESAVKSLVDAL